MKQIFKRILSAALAVCTVMPAAWVGAVHAEDDVVTALFEHVQWSFSYDSNSAWNANTFSSAKNGTPLVSQPFGNSAYGVSGTSGANDKFDLIYKPDGNISGYEVEFYAKSNKSGGSNFADTTSSIAYSADNTNWTVLNNGDNYKRTNKIVYYVAPNLPGSDGTKVTTPDGDVFLHTMTNTKPLPPDTKYFKVHTEHKSWKSCFIGLKLWGYYDAQDETAALLKAEMTADKILNGQAANKVENTIVLPAATESGYPLSWTSSNSAVINPETGAVTKSGRPVNVVLTASTAYEADGETTKAHFEYSLTVPADGEIESSAEVFTYGGANGLKSDSEIFDGVKMVGWTMSNVNPSEPLFRANAQDMGNGETAYALVRRTGGTNNLAGYVTYKVPDMNSFSVSFILGKYDNVVPSLPTFSVSADGARFTDVSEIEQKGEISDINGVLTRVTFDGYNLPVGTAYLRINVPLPPRNNDEGYARMQLEKVKVNQNAVLGEWSKNASVDVSYSQTAAKLEWPEFTGENDFVYEIMQDGKYIASVEKGVTSYEVTGLEEHTEYRFAVTAVQRNSDIFADKTSSIITSDIKKTSGDANVFTDKFKFEETISDYARWSAAIQYNADNQTVHRANAADDLYATYEIDGLISSFSVDMLAYRGASSEKIPGESGFEVSADGVNWYAVAANKTGSTPGTYATAEWNYSLSDVQELYPDARWLRIKFGDVETAKKRISGIQLKKVTVNTVHYAYTWPENSVLEVSDITSSSAKISWQSVMEGGAVNYEIYVNDKLRATVNKTEFVIDGLEKNSAVSVYVQAKSPSNSGEFSKKLIADGFRTPRKLGIPCEKISPSASSIVLSNSAGDVVSASATVSDVGANGATLGFKQADGSLGNAYVKIYDKYTEYYKNNTLLYTLNHSEKDAYTVTTDDCEITEDGQTLFIEGASWSGVTLYQTDAEDNVYYENAKIDAASGAVAVNFDTDNMPLENLSREFTFEANVMLPANPMRNMQIALIGANGAKLAELTETMAFSHGKDGALYLAYANTPLYEARTWLPRLEFDGGARNLKLFVNPAEKTVAVAIDNKVVAEDLSVTDVNAADLAGITVSGCVMTGVKVRGGICGFAYKPIAAVDGMRVDDGDKAALRLEIVSSDAERTVQLFAKQDNADGKTVEINAGDIVTVEATQGWKTVDLTVTAAAQRIKAYAWDSTEGMTPLGDVGGYYGVAEGEENRRLFLIGDSTVRYVYMEENIGWGEVIDQFLNDSIEVYNYAKDGTSSKTYWQSGRLNAMKPYMREGDYLMFQLGHNDRHTNPDKGTTTEEYKSYLRNFVKEARALGLNMIFVTPVTVQPFVDAKYINDRTSTNLYPFAHAMEEVAAELDVPIIDLFGKSVSGLLEAGVTTSDKAGIYTDGTHFTEAGAKLLCTFIKELLTECEDTDLDRYFR